jgi:hypothetical protein
MKVISKVAAGVDIYQRFGNGVVDDINEPGHWRTRKGIDENRIAVIG